MWETQPLVSRRLGTGNALTAEGGQANQHPRPRHVPIELDTPTPACGQIANDRQAKAGPAGHVPPRVSAVEAIEDSSRVGRIDSRPVVGHREQPTGSRRDLD